MKQIKHQLGRIEIIYLISEKGQTSMLLLPEGTMQDAVCLKEQKPWAFSPTAEYNFDWKQGTLVHLHLSHHGCSKGSGQTFKFNESEELLTYQSQDVIRADGRTTIVTGLQAEGQYAVRHYVEYCEGDEALICWCEFENTGTGEVTLEMFSSFALDGLSPFCGDDQTGRIRLHRFLGGWALEGKHKTDTAEDLGLQKAWAGAFPVNEKFGSVGSYPVDKYFGTALVEDQDAGVIWGAQIEHNASWQMELTRFGDNLSFSGGLADADFGAWSKRIAPGEAFPSPRVYLTAVKGDWEEAVQALTGIQKHACRAYGEPGLGIVFNEYCSSWGNPDQNKMLQYAKALTGHGVKYLVIDAGWSKGSREQYGNGAWEIDEIRFPDMKAMNRTLREKGMIPGIWLEFEVTTKGSVLFEKEYDAFHLKRNGNVIRSENFRSYWDFRIPGVREELKNKMVSLLRDQEFGYLKVDYNANTGSGCDGTESAGEELRIHLQYVREFFKDLKKELPELIIENCASGGHRMEPSMIGVSAMTSFSDAHEAKEIPYIAANEQYLMLPRQNQIWVVLHKTDDRQRICYSLAAGFLGRICLSGDVTELEQWQWDLADEAIRFYRRAEDALINGTTHVYGDRSLHLRHPKGTQVVVRRSENSVLVVCHAFGKRDESAGEQTLKIPIEETAGWKAEFNNQWIRKDGDHLLISGMPSWSACAVLYTI